VVSLALVAALTTGCAASTTGPIAVTGTVDDVLLTVVTPSIGAVAPNPNAGFYPVPLTSKATPTPAPLRVTWAVEEGTRVQPGDALVRTDAGPLDAALVMAQADAGRARAQVDLLASNIADLDTKTSDLRTQRQTISDGLKTLAQKRAELVTTRQTLTNQRPAVVQAIADLTAQRTTLVATIADLTAKKTALLATVADLTAKRTALVASIADLQAELAAAIAASSPDVPQLQAALAQAQAALAQLDAGLTQSQAGLAQLTTGITKAQAGLTQLDAGLAKATSGLAQLDSGLAQIATGLATIDQKTHQAKDGLTAVDDGLTKVGDARTQLTNARDLATIAISGYDLAVQQAQQQRNLATITATSAGVVVAAPRVGDVVLASTPLVRIREDQPSTVTAWLAPDEAARLCTGDAALITTDGGTTLDAVLTRIGTDVAYPPSSVATELTHLTRATAVTVTTSGTLPPGWPVDLRLTPCRTV
jgi:X-X-X-Leu-X-X-Gly heptad repeat protein